MLTAAATAAPRSRKAEPENDEAEQFEQWMKIAADNKINTDNSWSVALIDYFSDMKILRDGDSINFQRASCTLDGCMKIYTSRVDSVATETSRLLSGLSEELSPKKPSKRGDDSKEEGDEGDDDDGEERDADAQSGAEISRKRKKAEMSNTLEKTVANLNVKKLETDLNMDPLFRKTSTDFDESGVSSLLLNRLGVGGRCRLLLDSSEEVETDETAAEASESLPQATTAPAASVQRDNLVDLGRLCSKFFNYSKQEFFSKEICRPLRSFSLERPLEFSLSEISSFTNPDDASDDSSMQCGNEPSKVSGDNHRFDGVENGADDADFILDDGGGGFAQDTDDTSEREYGDVDDGSAMEPTVTNNGLNRTMTGSLAPFDLITPLEKNENPYSYFDATMLKGWTGHAHWRIFRKRPQQLNQQSQLEGSGNDDMAQDDVLERENQNQARSKSAKKAAGVSIDFLDFTNRPEKSVVQPTASAAANTSTRRLSSSAPLDIRQHLLPEDHHFTSEQLLCLFTKPLWKIHRQKTQLKRRENDSAFALESPWSEFGGDDLTIFAEEQAAGQYAKEGIMSSIEPTSGAQVDAAAAAPGARNTSEDTGTDSDDDGHEFDDDFAENARSYYLGLGNTYDLDLGGGVSLVNAPRLTKTLKINFAKAPKKIDVHKLKENMWDVMTDSKVVANPTPQEHAQPQSLTSVMKRLADHSPKKKDVSVSFCFICLLHLANENNLSIEGSSALNELSIKFA